MKALHAAGLGTTLAAGTMLAGPSMTIVGSDGTPAVSFRVMPTKIARGSGLVAFGEF